MQSELNKGTTMTFYFRTDVREVQDYNNPERLPKKVLSHRAEKLKQKREKQKKSEKAKNTLENIAEISETSRE